MQKKLFISGLLFLAVAMFLSFSSKALAITPTLSLSPLGDGDSVQINVTGDSNSSVLLFYDKSGFGQQTSPIGITNTNGILTTTISSSSYGIPSGDMVHISLGGINGPQSYNISWPAVASLISSNNMFSLSQTGLVLSIGQSATITTSNIGSSSIFLSQNSSPIIANFSISGSQIIVFANSFGSTTGTFCLINNTSNCESIYVTVQNSNVQPLTFSQSSISISSGQTIAIQISGGSGSYSVLNNSSQNNGVVTTNISGSTITLTTNSTSGSSSITVCSTNATSCGIINVTIGNAVSSAVSFSQTNPTVTVAQSLNISIFGPSGSLFYVASNSNPNIVQANLSGTTLTLLGITNGSSTISVCASTNNCGSLTITVNYDSSNGGRLMLSQDNASLSVGQTLNITISGGIMPYSILSTVNNIFQPTLNGNMLSLYGISGGSSSMNVCSPTAGSCVSLFVTVNGTNPVSTLPNGCSSLSGYSPITGLACNTISAITSTLPDGCSSLSRYSTTTGLVCNTISTIISTPTYIPPTSASNTSSIFKFTKSIKLGSSGAEVKELQKKLKTLGFYNGKIDGGFGSTTEKAVKAFQKAHKLSQLGSVGPATRTLLNK